MAQPPTPDAGTWRPVYGPSSESFSAPSAPPGLHQPAAHQLPSSVEPPALPPASSSSSSSLEKARKRKVWIWLSIIIIGFGVSIFVNAVAGDLLPQSAQSLAIRCKAAGGAESSVSTFAWVAVAIVQPVYALSMGRAIALMMIYLYLTRDAVNKENKNKKAMAVLMAASPASGSNAAALVPAASSFHAASPLLPPQDSFTTKLALLFCTREHYSKTSQKLFPVMIGLFNCIAYSSFIALTALAEVSTWSSMVGLFAVFPVSYGILFKGESKTPRKLSGVALCIAAAIVLAMADGEKQQPGGSSDSTADPSGDGSSGSGTITQPLAAIDAGIGVKLVLYFVAVVFWGLSDGMSAYILNEGNAKAAASAAIAKPPSASSSLASADAQAQRPFDGSSLVVGSGTTASSGAIVAVAGSPPLSSSSSSSPSTKRAPLTMIEITLLTALGFVIYAAMVGGLSLLLNALIHLPLVPVPAAADGSSPGVPQAVVTCFQQQMAIAEVKANSSAYGGGLFLIFVGQLLGKIAWFSVVQLGTLSEVSSFIPLIGLDVMITSILGIVVLGERPAPIGYLGFAMAAAGIYAIADTA